MTDFETRALALLTEIRDALVAVLGAGDGPSPCLHPEEARVSLSAMGDIRWTCRQCGYAYPPPAATD